MSLSGSDAADSARLTPPRVEATIDLPDGRRMGIAEFGPPRGRPVLWFHGTPGGRHQIPESLRRSLHDQDARVIVVERPGYGESTHHLYADIRSVNDDIDCLLEALGIERFGVAGLSGGGPYALAVSRDHSDRVVAAGVLGGVVPHLGPEAVAGGLVAALSPLAGVARVASRPVGAALGFAVQLMGPVEKPVFGLTTRMFPHGDRVVFGIPDIEAMFLEDIKQTARGGLSGPMLDLVLFTRDWGFRLADVSVPVHFWQGDADPIVTLVQAEKMAEAVPGASFSVRPGESHLGGFAAASQAIAVVLDHWPH